jgi:hypothetical protein
VGLARDWNCREGDCGFRLKMAGEAYQVELEQDHLLDGLSSLRGRRVRVFGYRLESGLPSAQAQGTSQQVAENGVVDARLIDLGVRWWVWWRPAWSTVYQNQDGGKAVWVYSIVDRNPYSTIEMEEHPTLKRGERILARGQWLPGMPAEYGRTAVRPYRSGEGSMTFVVESLYRLAGDVYIPVADEPATTPQPTVTLRPTSNP